MLLLEPHGHTTTFITLLYVPLGGSLPAAAGMLGPMLAVVFALLAGSLVVFRRVVGHGLTFLRHHWPWTMIMVVCLSLMSGALALWWP